MCCKNWLAVAIFPSPHPSPPARRASSPAVPLTFGETLLGLVALLSHLCHLLLLRRGGFVIHCAAHGRGVVAGQGVLQRDRNSGQALGLWLPPAMLLLPQRAQAGPGGCWDPLVWRMFRVPLHGHTAQKLLSHPGLQTLEDCWYLSFAFHPGSEEQKVP